MSVVRLQTLTPAEAEEAIASIWQVLERYGIATPQMTVTHLTVTHYSGIMVELLFTSPNDADRVADSLRNDTFVHVWREWVA